MGNVPKTSLRKGSTRFKSLRTFWNFLRGSYGNGFKYGRHGRFRTADLYRVKVLKPMDFA